jgi:hypothetical protein
MPNPLLPNERPFTFDDIIKDHGLAYKLTDAEFAAVLANYEKQETACKPVDIEVKKNRAAITSAAAAYPRLRVKLDDKGKEIVAGWKAQSKTVDNRRKAIRDTLDRIRDTVRAPLNEWEQAQAAQARRVAEDEAQIVNLRDTGWRTSADCRQGTADLLAINLSEELHGKELPRLKGWRMAALAIMHRQLEALKRAEGAEEALLASQAMDLPEAFQIAASAPENQPQPAYAHASPSRPGYVVSKDPQSISFYDKDDDSVEMVRVRLTASSRGMRLAQAIFVNLIDAHGARIWNTQGTELLRFDPLSIYSKL